MNYRGYVEVPGSARTDAPGSRIIGRPHPLRLITVSVLVRPRVSHEAHLAAALNMMNLKPHERQYLSREEYTATHGADPEDVAQVARFARRNGLRVVRHNPAQRIVLLRGTIAAFRRAFATPLYIFRSHLGTYRGRRGAVHIPQELEGIVEGVFGLDNRPQAKPHFRLRRQFGGAWAHTPERSYVPQQVGNLYNFPTGGDGEGECIGIIELGGGYRISDLNAYFQALGLSTPQVSAVSVRGGMNAPTGNPNGPDGEVMLDIEVAGAIAPGAKIVVYFAPNTTGGFLAAVNAAIFDRTNKPSVVSISWGGAEPTWTAQALKAFDRAFQAAALLGVTICCASGDDGSSDGLPVGAHVDFPASSVHALACGGTRLESLNNVVTSEEVWNDGAGGGAGGGGVSKFFSLPPWQADSNVPVAPGPGKFAGRGVPDISANADPVTGYQVRVDGVNTVIGGTSAVAPLWAGLIALMNQQLGKPVGFLNSLLYQIQGSTEGAFRDITEGNNDISNLGVYNAVKGWDAASGLGSADGTALLNALQ